MPITVLCFIYIFYIILYLFFFSFITEIYICVYIIGYPTKYQQVVTDTDNLRWKSDGVDGIVLDSGIGGLLIRNREPWAGQV